MPHNLETVKKIVPGPCSVLRNNSHPGQGTVIVLGTPRGGTSVVAGICHMLGVDMGISIDSSNIEDVDFQALITKGYDKKVAKKYFRRLRSKNKIAGIKNPLMIYHIKDIYPLIDQPIFVVVSRDEVATAQREDVEGYEFHVALEEVRRMKSAILDFVNSVVEPVILISYERLLQNSRSAILSISSFLGCEAPNDLVQKTSLLVKANCDMPNEVDFVAERMAYEKLSKLRQQEAAG